MKGSLRVLLGLLITFGAVGGLDNNPDASVLSLTMLACLGLAIMADGVLAMKKN